METTFARLANRAERGVSKIFGIGLSRTGTTTLYHLMKDFGFTAVHYPASMAEIDEHFFCNDTTISARFEELDRLYPNAKFIYTTRSTHRWARSCMNRFAMDERLAVIRNMPQPIKQWFDAADLSLYGYDQLGLATMAEEEFIAAYHRYDSRVKHYFAERPEDLLTLNLTDSNTYPLTAFIGFLEQHGVVGMPKTNSNLGAYSHAWKR